MSGLTEVISFFIYVNKVVIAGDERGRYLEESIGEGRDEIRVQVDAHFERRVLRYAQVASVQGRELVHLASRALPHCLCSDGRAVCRTIESMCE